ncbi:MAG: CpaD family pilus assembly lipoprotein [Pseudomonadota bacterium]|nr:CpaD family pilus assembly lipoprotein [Pseudomonadota bacterium]MEE3323232.1 CpaD family pilus assembly lipoprotein [Pseudomonadota bacterium]
MTIQRNILLLSLSCIALSACGGDNYFTPTSMTKRNIEVVESAYEQSIALSDVSPAALASIVDNYKRYGVDTLNMTVSYDPQPSGGFSASDAMGKAAEITKALRENYSMKNVHIGLLPVKNQPPKLFIDYTKQEAFAPEGCPDMPGYDSSGANTEDMHENYEFGCGVKSTMIKQVYRQKDLTGTSGRDEDYNGRRSIRNLYGTGYFDGAPNPQLEGESSSEEN